MCNCSQAHSLVYLLFHNHIINKKLTLALTLPRVGCRSGVGVYLKVVVVGVGGHELM